MLTIFLLTLLAALVVVKFVKIASHWSSRDVPYEPLHTAFYRSFWGTKNQNIAAILRNDVRRYGTFYGTFRGITPSLVVADVDLAKEVLVTKFGTFFERSFEFHCGDPLVDKGLSRLPYAQWKPLRTLVSQCLTTSKMRGMISKLDKVAKQLVDRLDRSTSSDGDELILKQFLQNSILDSMAAIAFGLELNCSEDPNNPYLYHSLQVTRISVAMIGYMLFPKLMRFIPFLRYPPKATSEFFTKLSRHVLSEKRKKLDEVIANGNADIIDLHLIAQRDDPSGLLTDETLISQIFGFFVAGMDPTYLTLDLVTYYLAINPDIQERVHAEVKHVMEDRTDFQYEDLQRMNLLKASLLEALRLLPSGLLVDRFAAEDTELGGVKVPKGMGVFIVTAHIHRDPNYFPDPDEFRPDRFLNTDQTSQTRAFLNFGDGPKNCVGKRVALMNMQTILGNILMRFRLERCPATTVPLRLKKGFHFVDFVEEPIVIRLRKRS